VASNALCIVFTFWLPSPATAGTEISPKFLRKLLKKYFGAKSDEWDAREMRVS
jgi:hypothetical protein